MLQSTSEVLTSVNLEILRGEMQLRVEPSSNKPTMQQFESRQEVSGTLTANFGPVTSRERLAKLENDLEIQEEEEEKWEDLTRKLVKKSKQMDDMAIRLDTSIKVFQGELVKRTEKVTFAQAQLQMKRDQANAELDKLRDDLVKQRELASNAKDKAEDAREELGEKEARQEFLTKKLKTARSCLLPLEDRVQQLQANLHGNNAFSDSQRIYYDAECQVEMDQRDRVLIQIENALEELEVLTREISILKGKQELFDDECKRRTVKTRELQAEIQEQQGFLNAKLEKYNKEMDTIRADRDAWEEKTLKLVDDLEENKIESQKLQVKVHLFGQQLKGIRATVQRLESRIEASLNASVTSISSERDEPAPVPAKPEPATPVNKDAYVWQPPQKQTAPRVEPKVSAPVKTVPRYVPSAVSKPTYAPAPVGAIRNVPTVKVHHVSVKMDPVNPGYLFKPQKILDVTPSSVSAVVDSDLDAKLQAVQRDLEHQKRFQKEHALKLEQQVARLVSEVEVLANDAELSSHKIQDASVESQLQTLKHQMQKDAMRDAHEMRQLIKQMTQQCSQLSTEMADLTSEVHKREKENTRLEQKLQEKEAQYFEQMEYLRKEMELQLERQQKAFADKMSRAMIQMERLVMADRASNLQGNGDSMTSLESLVPLDNSFHSRGGPGDAAAEGTRGFSMVTSGTTVSSPLFQK